MATAADYSRKIDEYARTRIGVAERSRRMSTLRLVTSLPAAAIVVWMLSRGFSLAPTAIAAVLLLAFAVLVVRHARIEEQLAWLDALQLANIRARARLARDWSVLPQPQPPPGIDLTHHPYALDLDLFGRASLYQWLGPAATASGARTLAEWLLTAAGNLRSRNWRRRATGASILPRTASCPAAPAARRSRRSSPGPRAITRSGRTRRSCSGRCTC
jgi:hypothetical protein